MPSDPAEDRLLRRGTLLLLAVAALVRGVVVWRMGGSLNNDPDLYLEIARSLVDGDGFATLRGPTAYRPPLYPLLLAGILKAGGGTRAIGAVQAVLGVLTVGLTTWCGHRLRLGRWSLLAGLLVAVDPLLLNATVQTMTETLATFLATALLVVLPNWSEARRPTRTFVAGVTVGLAMLCRPTFAPFALLWFAGLPTWPRLFRVELRHWLAHGLVLALGVILVVGPWVVRNLLVFDEPVVTTTHGGYTLYLGHNPVYYDRVVRQPWGTVWDGPSLLAWQAELESRLSQETPRLDLRAGSPVNEVARDRWMQRQAWRAIVADPLMAARAGLTLLGRFWNVVPSGPQTERLPRVVLWGIGGFYLLTFVGVAASLFRIRADEWPRWWPAAALIVSFTLVHSVYWADMRMRAPLVPALALLAVRGLRPGRSPQE